jgi:HPt (histidine-containing phosphotransfer) domain-containing protein
MAGDREKCLAAGMDDYMSKPIKRDLLEEMLRKWLAKTPASVDNVASVSEETTPMPNAIDATVIQELYEVMDTEFAALLQDYLSDAPRLLTEIALAIKAGDAATLVRPAHSLKSSSGNVGALRVAEIAKTLESQARQGQIATAVALFGQMQREYMQAVVELKVMVQQGKP